jgi:hypothetical protein
MRLRLIGDKSRYLARRCLEHGMVDNSDDEESVELYPSRLHLAQRPYMTPI